jgi:hypothetical protein
MEFGQIRVMEHLAIDSPLSLSEFCEAMQRRFGLPDFEFDSENETEWGLVEHEGVEYNVSRPYERGTLEEWDGSVPAGCNFGVTLMVSQQCPAGRDVAWSSAELVPLIGQGLADLLGSRVYHHRSWVQGGENLVRKRVFTPAG